MEAILNILIVEDDPGDILTINELIASTGIAVESANISTLKESIRLCRRSYYDIILLDLSLPDSNGLNTLISLHASNDRSPIVVMTGLDDEDIALEALREGAQDYLVKGRLTTDCIVKTLKYSIERKKIEDLHKQYTLRFSILSAATGALNECEDIPSIFRVICGNLRNLPGIAGAVAVEFPEPGKASISGVEWLRPWFGRIQRLTGWNLNDPEFRFSENSGKIREVFGNNRLRPLKGGLYGTFAGFIEGYCSDGLEKTLGITYTYSIGFLQHKIIYGGFLVFSCDKINNDDTNVIETISNQTALNLHRRAIEKDLRLSKERYKRLNKELEKIVNERTSDLVSVNRQLQKELSERIRAERALKKNEAQLRELNATKDKFFNIVAHDLKNPFTSLLGSSELLFQNVNHLDANNIKKLAAILNDSAKSGYAILQNLLDWSRSQTGMLKINPGQINLRNLVDENILNMELFSMNKEITVQSEVSDDVYIYADKNMLNTILRNLISNALKFSYRSGTVTVKAVRVKDEVIISVKDSGVGIPSENIDKLFRIDTKYSMPGTENEHGTGLGLKLCKELVEKQGGSIWVESEPEKGSEFIFTIPDRKRKE